ncbi:MAG: polysaccharide deacetylase [Rhodospirillales bacterium]
MIDNPVPWPDGARCAVAFTFDMDADSFLHLTHPNDAHRRVAAISELQYGPKVGVPRILDLYERYGLKQSFYIPAWCIETYPDTVDAIVKAGHEVGHHGYLHEHPNERSLDEERYWLQLGIEIIERHTGKRPRGYRAPLYKFSDNTLDLLLDEGFEYDASLMGDDVPYVIRSKKGDMVELPSHWGLDDWPPYVHMSDIDFMMPIKAPSDAIVAFRDEFDAAWEYGGLWIGVWHPFVTGRLSRMKAVEGLIEYMLDKGNVWIASMEEISAHVRQVIEKGTFRPRVCDLPQYDRPVTIPEFGGE